MERMLEATARAEDRHFWFRGLRRHARLLLDEARAGGRGGLILDCGAGTGRNLDWLNDFGLAIGVERSPAGLRVGRQFGRRLVRGTVTRLPLGDASVDVTTSFDVLYCLDDDDEREAVREMWRVLKPGGLALVNAAALDLLHGSHSALTHERRRYTPRRLAALLTGAGFSIGRMTYTNMTLFPLTLAVRWRDRRQGRAEVAAETDLQVPPAPVNALLSAAVAVDGLLLRLVDLPIGSSLMCVARKHGETAGRGLAATTNVRAHADR
jgi:SAM-dependent methyltransferase